MRGISQDAEFCFTCQRLRCKCPDRLTGFIYFILAGNGLIKVGYTNKITRRIRQLKTGNACELTVLKVVMGNYPLEGLIKKCLKESQHHNEWYTATPKLLEFIKSLRPRSEVTAKQIKIGLRPDGCSD